VEAVVKRVVIKWTYLLAVIAFGVWVFNAFWGGNVYLRAEGLVLAQPAVVATEYNVTVRDMMVKEGERVTEGQVVVQISSQQALEGLARLSSEAASRAARLVELDVRSEVVNAMLAPAEHREAVAVEGKNQLNEIYKKGLLPVISRTAAAEQAYNGQRDAEVLRAEKRALTDQIKMLAGATSQADRALSDLLDAFDHGRLHAPITGTVSAVLANRGAVVRAGIRYWNWSAITDSSPPGFRSAGGTNWKSVKALPSMQETASCAERSRESARWRRPCRGSFKRPSRRPSGCN
jgi:multidrug efflux pump subunit AcrA (membrane-fusion protein)